MKPMPKPVALFIRGLEIHMKLWTWDDVLIKDLKALIAAQEGGIPAKEQMLAIDTRHGRTSLDDGRTLASYGIDHQSFVHVEAATQNIPIFVVISDHVSIELSMPKDSMVEALKMRIASDVNGLPYDEQRLVFRGVEMDARRTLISYGIHSASFVFMTSRIQDRQFLPLLQLDLPLVHPRDPFEPIRVIVVTQKEAVQYSVGNPHIVNSLMGMIQTRQGIPLDRQMLFFKGEELKEFSCLSERGISTGDFIHLEIKSGRLGAFRMHAKNWAHQHISAQMVAPAIKAIEVLRS